jgi:hypothetical protein
MKQRKRRRLFPIIYVSLQYRFLAMILFYGAITVIFMAVFLLVPDILAVSNEKLSMEMRAAAAQRVLALHSRLWPAIISLVCILAVHSSRLFLHVVGPLYRMGLVFKEVDQGNLSVRLKFRKRDYLHREAELFSKMMMTLEEKWQAIQTIGEDGIKSLASLEKSTAEKREGRDSIEQILRAYRQHLKNLMEKSKYFRLTDKKENEQETSQKGE